MLIVARAAARRKPPQPGQRPQGCLRCGRPASLQQPGHLCQRGIRARCPAPVPLLSRNGSLSGAAWAVGFCYCKRLQRYTFRAFRVFRGESSRLARMAELGHGSRKRTRRTSQLGGLPGASNQAGCLRQTPCAGHRVAEEPGTSLRIADSFASSSTPSARLKTATPPIQPVKPTLRLLWMTRPMVNGPPLPSFGGA